MVTIVAPKPAYQGPQQPGKYFTSTGGSQSISQIAIKHFEESTGFKGKSPPEGYVRGVSPTISEITAIQPLKEQVQVTKIAAQQLSNKQIQAYRQQQQQNQLNQLNFQNIPSKDIRTFSGGTRENLGIIKTNEQPILSPTLVERQKGTFEYKGKQVPEKELVYFDPYGQPIKVNSAAGYVSIERPATKEEFDYFQKQNSILQASTEKPGAIFRLTGGYASSVGDIYNLGNERMKETFTSFLPKLSSEDLMASLEQSQKNVPNWLKLGKGEKRAIGFGSGVAIGIYEDIRTQPLKNAVLFGGGYIFGGAVKGGITVVSSIPKIGKFLGTTTKIGSNAIGLGLGGVYVLETTGKIITAKTPMERGGIFGVGLKDISLMGFGYAKGEKAFTQLRGLYVTRGRTELVVKQGEYPQAPTKKQLSLFQKNVISELGEIPGAFHTTSENFWKKTGLIEPQAGTSELPGLYGSTQVSTPFARISGQGSSSKIFPSIKELFSIEGKPGIAYLKPKGFRYSSFERVSPYKIGEQTFRYAFVKSAKLGYADIPGMKPEIESIFRINAGQYKFESGKYYTKIKGVRVPIDVFGFGGKKETSAISSFGKGRYSSYKMPSSYVFAPQSFGLFALTKSKSYSASKASFASYSPKRFASYLNILGSQVNRSRKSNLYSSTSLSGLSLISKVSRGSSRKSNFLFSSYLRSLKSSRGSGGGSSTNIYGSNYFTSGKRGGYYKPKFIPQKISLSSFVVSIRRRGKFLPVGIFGSYRQAFNVGVLKVSRTLAASFKISGMPQIPQTPIGFYLSRKESKVFIEKIGRRLKRGTPEIPEIQYYKRRGR